jgi:mannose-1-phosphate guanylyltransferase / phosphomannomutase
MFCVAKLIELLAKEKRHLSNIRQQLPRVFQDVTKVRCPWGAKGGLMRHILETHHSEKLDTEDGVKIYNSRNDNWVLVLPDAGEPVIHIYANSNDRDWLDLNLQNYRQLVQDYVGQYQGATE